MIWARRMGLVVLLAWGAFWVWFNVASAFGEGGVDPRHLILAAIIAVATVVPWRWPIRGSIALVALGGLSLALFGPSPFLLLALDAPPIVAAALLSTAARAGRKCPVAA